MTSVDRTIAASAENIWSVLANGKGYADWVVGAAKIREVDSNWPQTGSMLHHTVGVFPIRFRDTTSVLQSQKDEFLELRGRVRPLGKARISFAFEMVFDGTKVTMDEVVDKGLAAKFYGRLMKKSIRGRNTETLRRLEETVKSLQ